MIACGDLEAFGNVSILNSAAPCYRHIVSSGNGLKRIRLLAKSFHPSEFSGGVGIICDLKDGLVFWIFIIDSSLQHQQFIRIRWFGILLHCSCPPCTLNPDCCGGLPIEIWFGILRLKQRHSTTPSQLCDCVTHTEQQNESESNWHHMRTSP